MEEQKSLRSLRWSRRIARITGNQDEVTRLDILIEKREQAEKKPKGVHTNHHKKTQDDLYLVEDQEIEE